MCTKLIILTFSIIIALLAIVFTSSVFVEQRQYIVNLLKPILPSQFLNLFKGFSLKKEIIFTKDDLKHYEGHKSSKGLYLAVLGEVYDVSKGSKHYAPGGGYHFFAGKDASRAFISGDFSSKGLTDDLTGLDALSVFGLEDWKSLYQKQYTYVGKVCGTYYDCEMGAGTPALERVHAQMVEARRLKQAEQDESQIFPPCNSQWSKDKGGMLWCSDKSGGIERNWAGVPRQMHKPGMETARCVCVRTSGPPSDQSTDKEHSNRGDLDNPNLKEYPNCPPDSLSCPIQK